MGWGRVRAVLVLEDGTVFWGRGFGSPGLAVGEVVFTTGMVGYTESLTDPSYIGQILCFTYPLVGNYGVPPYSMTDEHGLPLHFESWGIKVEGVVAHEVCFTPSHWSSIMDIDEWLRREGVPGIWGIDTRRLTAKLREQGVMMGALKTYEEGDDLDIGELRELVRRVEYGSTNYVVRASVNSPVFYESMHGHRGLIAVIDCGVKLSIVRSLLRRGYDVILLPHNVTASEVMKLDPAGVVVSNGPGNPKLCMETIDVVRNLIEYGVPILGICLGHQIISLALGADTYKLPYGHRGQNKPCIDLRTGRCYVTSQNHGYAVDPSTLEGTGLKLWFINADDKTVEGVIDEGRRILGVQFHPEASPGPNDTAWVFDYFIKLLER
ncbi:MAG: carbamoyl-phosphate synthase small subunit [Thermoprotei archaeon]|nr:MAG: carbamoyl-phosphate synthase small subunit [Thermoprotei archaeon]